VGLWRVLVKRRRAKEELRGVKPFDNMHVPPQTEQCQSE
jgi:hypothetical protein